jgi:hypothetical protein
VILVVIGGALVLIALALQVKADAVISRVTSRSLGSLAAGYAATRRGVGVYAALIAMVGWAVLGLGLLTWTIYGIWLFVAAVALFVVLSIFAIVGEVRVYRALKR